ncbi:MAG: hypothetical protein JXR62_05835 [Bacilli bacterium]|nr:hypothetical protein [Bacilli bacterium]
MRNLFRKGFTFLMFLTLVFSPKPVSAHTELYSCYSSTCTLSLNYLYETSISSAGETDTFKFTPSTSGYYVIETYGILDTYMSRYLSPYLTLTNDDGGERLNSNMGFSATSGQQYTFNIKAFSSSATGLYYIQVRRQTASIMTFDYGPGEIDTTNDAVYPISQLTSMGYIALDFQNSSETTLKDHDFTGIDRFNKEIIMFSGHGGPGYAQVSNYLFDTSTLYSTELPYMGNVKLAIWATCHSANESGTLNSTSKQSVLNGARSSIGWPDTTTTISSAVFTSNLFFKLNQGYTIDAAASYASSQVIFPWDNVKDYIVYGDGNTTISSSVNNKQNSVSYIPLYNDDPFWMINYSNPITFSSNDNSMKISENIASIDLGVKFNEMQVTRNYMMIEGYLTNVYYDTIDNGSIEVNRSFNQLNDYELVGNKSISKNDFEINYQKLSGNFVNYQIFSVEEHKVFIKDSDHLKFVKIAYVTFYNSMNNTWVSEAYAYDIITGEELTYFEIGFEKEY